MVSRTISPTLTDKSEATELDRLMASWMRHMRGSKAEATMRAYRYAVVALRDFLVAAGMPTDPQWITREHVEAFIDDQIVRNSAATAKLRRTYLSVFFTWLVDEDEITRNPVTKSKVPKVADKPLDDIDDGQWGKLLDTVKGRSLHDRRDAAILRVLESSGMRRAEVASLRIGDVDLDTMLVTVRVKGGDTERRVINDAAAAAIDRWLRARKDPITPDRPLWVGRAGAALTGEGLAEVVRRRGRQAGLTIHAHQFRHRWAAMNKADNMSDENLKALGGWKSDKIVPRYGRATTERRAVDQYREIQRKRDARS